MRKISITIKFGIIIFVVVMILIITTNDNNETYAVGDTLASVVIAQSKGTTWSSGASGVYNTKYTKEDGTTIGSDYRYIGANVKNYIKFNNDMYQIIGVFDENSHGKTGEQLVKLIRARILGDFSWGVCNTSSSSGIYHSYFADWTGTTRTTPANLNILLNQYFLNKTDESPTYGNCSNWTYFYSGNDYKTKDCQTLVGFGIDDSIRDYIETTTWHLNGANAKELISNDFYLCERGIYAHCISLNSGSTETSTNAKIGLMYVSDYMYASGYKESGNTLTNYSSYNGSQNWLFKGREWTITPNLSNGSSNRVFDVHYQGLIHYMGSSPQESSGVRPTFYLKSGVYVTGGNGSFDNPYTIACDNCG